MNIYKKEYVEFWAEVEQKICEIQKKYNSLSEPTKQQIDRTKEIFMKAHSVQEIMNIIRSQTH